VEIWLLAFLPAAAISSTICTRRIARQSGKYHIPLQLQYLGSLLLADGQANLVMYSPNHSWTPQKATEVNPAHLFLLFSATKLEVGQLFIILCKNILRLWKQIHISTEITASSLKRNSRFFVFS
jgi:hypothetical protein